MDWIHVILMIAGAVAGWIVRHYQTPAHHTAIDDLLSKVEKSKTLEKVKAVLGVGNTPPDKPAS